MDNKSLNLDKVPQGETLEVIKSFAGAGRICSNGATMYGVQHGGVIANLFIHDGIDTTDVVARMDRVAKGSTVTLFHNVDGSYALSTDGKNGSDPKVPPPPETNHISSVSAPVAESMISVRSTESSASETC